jgi:hypothetical protein
MTGLYSPINKLMEQVTRPKGTGAEYMAELSKKPGYKPAEAKYPMPDPKKPWLSYPERRHPHADEPRPNRPTPEQLAEMEFHPAYEESGRSPASYRDFY